MTVVKMITLSDEAQENVRTLAWQWRKALLRPVTETEVVQQALDVGLKALLSPIR